MKNSNLSKVLLVFVFLTYAFNTYSQSIETEVAVSEKVYHLDSLGNLINHKEALKLMRTGEYISIPKLNEFSEIEYLIRKRDPNNPLDKKHQVYTDGKTVVNTMGMPSFKSKLSMGDNIPELCAQSFSETLCLGKGASETKPTLLIYTTKKSWSSIKNKMMSLIKAYSEINFMIVQPNEKGILGDFFSKGFLKRTANVYLAKKPEDRFRVNHEPNSMYHLVDQSGKISLVIPPMANPDIAYGALSKYFDNQLMNK